ncbi:spore germination protein [Pseudalkalibacillus caeni]|uniref:Spore germination protein n=1 Tax=Exobacillus caeni TaxID=2574798 RepID=A0A5R9F7A4_9BACL|nr:spore germination protein [Pseudalkalibacillus caeni]TLS38216.1 spore germination protein [Pseudalkalibacillus caeni]
MFKWLKKKKETGVKELPDLIALFSESKDFLQYEFPQNPQPFLIYYLKTMVDDNTLHRDIMPYIKKESVQTLEDLKAEVPIENIIITDDLQKINDGLLHGSVVIRPGKGGKECAIIKAPVNFTRNVSAPEVEFSVIGPKEAFVESLDNNVNLIRKRLPVENFKMKQIKIGKLSKTKVAVLYLEGIANEENVNTVIQRLEDIQIDQINDSSYLAQLISDNANSPFPQLIDTERPDRVASVLGEGKVAILADGSPLAIIGPTTLVEFFSAFEDYFLNWIIASAFRTIRFVAVLFSLLITPTYVAVLTYHYELIPKDLMATLISSRREIPMPPILEAIFLELAIELLREAGARLPTKVGQTIGIVGGIVIGTASVEAGLTSNVLLIFVALAALGSFTTPVYRMSNTIRLIRFPFLLFAHLWGLLGVVIAFCFMLIHLLRLTSLGRPILEPLYPLRIPDLKDALIRLPFSFQSKRPVQLQTENTIRFKGAQAKKKNDFDE